MKIFQKQQGIFENFINKIYEMFDIFKYLIKSVYLIRKYEYNIPVLFTRETHAAI